MEKKWHFKTEEVTHKESEAYMKHKSVYLLVATAFLAVCVMTGCAGSGSTDAGVTEETAKDAAAANAIFSADNETEGGDSSDSSATGEGEAEPEGKEVEMETWKTAIEGLAEDFIFGMDVSSLLVEEKSGVKYYDFDGNEQDALKTFADSGINYIRLRVWNDPYDENGNGYGGGNNDLPTAIELGKRATGYGMKVLVDFHYSDFWADPQKQIVPKAWKGMSLSEKSSALYDYTKDSLGQLFDAGVDVGMVQIGNEINNGMSGETKIENVIELLKAGSKAVREISSERGKDIGIVVHYTDISPKEGVLALIEKLVNGGLDFDMMGLSYYPFWHGDMDNMKNVIKYIGEHFGKKAFIAETSYCYTLEDGDGFGNRVSKSDLVEGYPATIEGQASYMHDLYQNVNSAGGLGVFYWEGAWLPVGPANADNSLIWEKYGSGWASSFASDYDKDAAKYYGGSSWDNQAFFDFGGHPLESIKVFKYMK
ncbi:glycoside hydrolase family 53 protein [Butyrivibrio sp. AE3003]|uniref:glycoside hydrolase family 53 protein n=2 Tax=unclassified Butyrivibrio TaxID=2639466 RepID=UPI001FA6C7CA|nr:glycosyl hydrolase 53 family protein [Butyrivibrio sp. AE3003]